MLQGGIEPWTAPQQLLEPEIDHGLWGSAQCRGTGLLPMGDFAGDSGGRLGAKAALNQVPLRLTQGVRLERDQSTCRIVSCHARLPAPSHARLIIAVAQARDRDAEAGCPP